MTELEKLRDRFRNLFEAHLPDNARIVRNDEKAWEVEWGTEEAERTYVSIRLQAAGRHRRYRLEVRAESWAQWLSTGHSHDTFHEKQVIGDFIHINDLLGGGLEKPGVKWYGTDVELPAEHFVEDDLSAPIDSWNDYWLDQHLLRERI